MITVWRFVKKRHEDLADAFDGEGARIYGGRWNLPGTRMVYTAQTLSLAVMEQFVHLGPEDTHIQFVYFRIDIPEGLSIEELNPKKLPADWRVEPPSGSTQGIGTEWARSKRTAVLQVPSVIIPVEYNYTLNPNHPDFKHIRIAKPESFSLDPRMWKTMCPPS